MWNTKAYIMKKNVFDDSKNFFIITTLNLIKNKLF